MSHGEGKQLVESVGYRVSRKVACFIVVKLIRKWHIVLFNQHIKIWLSDPFPRPLNVNTFGDKSQVRLS